jgi:hypothetical protein
MVDYLIHFYKRGSRPFQSLSALPEREALSLMHSLYIEGSVFWERFQDPCEYLRFRRQVEGNLYKQFQDKGGRPKHDYPIYLMVGRPGWVVEAGDPITLQTTDEIRVPLSILREDEVSFTYPDSMVSALICQHKDASYYEPEYHGKAFTLQEMERIISVRGLPGEGWETSMPKHYAHYIEAQVWNKSVLEDYLTSRAYRSLSEPGVEDRGHSDGNP